MIVWWRKRGTALAHALGDPTGKLGLGITFLSRQDLHDIQSPASDSPQAEGEGPRKDEGGESGNQENIQTGGLMLYLTAAVFELHPEEPQART